MLQVYLNKLDLLHCAGQVVKLGCNSLRLPCMPKRQAQNSLGCKALHGDLIVDLQIGSPDKELALGSISVIFNVHEDILNGTGYNTPAGA